MIPFFVNLFLYVEKLFELIFSRFRMVSTFVEGASHIAATTSLSFLESSLQIFSYT